VTDTRPRLTPRQSQVLAFINSHVASHGYPPTRQEIAAHIGAKDPSGATSHLIALARKGYVTLTERTSRGIHVLVGVAATLGVGVNVDDADHCPCCGQPLPVPDNRQASL
jgi:SOS-response transcriptional repressor LexA